MLINIDVIVSQEYVGIAKEIGYGNFTLNDVKTEGVITGVVEIEDNLSGEELERALDRQEDPLIAFLEEEGWNIDNIYRGGKKNEI